MGCDRIIRKNSLPPLGSVKKNTQQRAPLQKGRRKRQNQEKSKLEDQNCGQNFKILDLWRITFLANPKASHVSSRDWWKTSSSGIKCYIKLPVVIKMGVSSFQLLGAGHRASRQLPAQGNAEWTCTLPDALLSWELWRYCSNSWLVFLLPLWGNKGWIHCLILYSSSPSEKGFSSLESNVLGEA